MWVRRDPVEIANLERRNRRRKLSPVGPLLLTLAATLLEFVVRRNTSLPFFSFTSRSFLIWFFLIFGSLYLSRILLGRYELFGTSRFVVSIKPAVICGRCHTVQNNRRSHICDCGGPLEPLDNWKWQPEHVDSK